MMSSANLSERYVISQDDPAFLSGNTRLGVRWAYQRSKLLGGMGGVALRADDEEGSRENSIWSEKIVLLA